MKRYLVTGVMKMMVELIVRIIILILSIVAFGMSVITLLYMIGWANELDNDIKRVRCETKRARGEEDGETI